MKVIDVHTHAFPEAIATRAVTGLSDKAGIHPFHDGTLHGLERSMHRAGIDLSVVLPVATRPEQVPSINAWILENAAPGRIFFGGIHPRCPGHAEQVRGLAAAGIRGVKMHPNFQQFLPDDPLLVPFFQILADAGLIVLMHAGHDFAFADAPGSPDRIARLLDRVPNLIMICAHFGGWRMWEDVEKHLLGRRNAYLDTSFALGYLPDRRMVDMSRRHGTDRILFGTDTPWRDQEEDLELFRRLPFTPAESQAILHDNAARLLRLSSASDPALAPLFAHSKASPG